MLRNAFDHFLGRLYPYFWKYRHVWSKGWPDSYLYEESINGKHRLKIVEALRTFQPFESVLDYGCGPGANLFVLARHFQEAKLYGTDISLKAIECARETFKDFENINVWNLHDEACEKHEPWDVVITDAVFIYLKDPGKVIEDLKKSMTKGYIGCEWHSDCDESFVFGRHWVHNYRKLFEGCEITKIEWDVPDKGWDTYGHIITWKK